MASRAVARLATTTSSAEWVNGFGGPGSGIVVGVEADAAYTDLDQHPHIRFSRVLLPTQSLFGTVSSFRSGLDYPWHRAWPSGLLLRSVPRSTARAVSLTAASTTACTYFNDGRDHDGSSAVRAADMETGYTYGGGVEYALPTNSFLNFFKSSAVTLKAEYLHYDLGRSTNIGLATTGLGCWIVHDPRLERGRSRPRRPELQVLVRH